MESRVVDRSIWWRRRLRNVIVAISAAAIVVALHGGLGLKSMAPAEVAAVGCYNKSCNYLYPYNEGCQYDGSALEIDYGDNFANHLMWSNACYANWGTISYPVGSGLHAESVYSGCICNPNNDNGVEGDSSAGWASTNLVDGQDWAYACGQDQNSHNCTSKY